MLGGWVAARTPGQPAAGASPFPVQIRVDASKSTGPLKQIWRFFGADEPNYAYMKDGKKLIADLGSLAPKRVYFRAHSLLVTGDGTPALKWGSTNAYTRGRAGQPDLRLDDRRSHLRHLPGARREALRADRLHARSAVDQAAALPARVDAAREYDEIYTGWAYPPKVSFAKTSVILTTEGVACADGIESGKDRALCTILPSLFQTAPTPLLCVDPGSHAESTCFVER